MGPNGSNWVRIGSNRSKLVQIGPTKINRSTKIKKIYIDQIGHSFDPWSCFGFYYMPKSAQRYQKVPKSDKKCQKVPKMPQKRPKSAKKVLKPGKNCLKVQQKSLMVEKSAESVKTCKKMCH